MGQTSSRGTPPGDRPPPSRSRFRPMSWASSSVLRPETEAGTSVPELQSIPSTSTSSAPSSRWLNIRSSRNSLLTSTSDAGSSGSTSQPDTHLIRRRSRITRARSSLSTTIPSLFRRRSTDGRRDDSSFTTSSPLSFPSMTPTNHRPTNNPFEPSPRLPRLEVPDLDLNFDDIADLPIATSSNDRTERVPLSRRENGYPSIFPSLRPDLGIRNMTASFRRRRSPLRREEDQAAMLSRLLSVAAAATAASLIGEDHRAVAEAHNVAGDGDEGTFASFLQALQNGRIASALRQSGNDNGEGSEQGGDNPVPLNFFRMFRFGSSSPRRTDDVSRPDGQNPSSSADSTNGEEDTDGRMVPIIIVGIRSINPGTASTQDDNIPPFLDAFSGFPPQLTTPGENTIDGMPRQPQNGTRFSHRRRASMGGLNPFPSNYDSQRHYRTSERPRPWSTFSDSPSGPLPPPSTPASSGLSAVSSGATSPTFSASPSYSTSQSATPSRRGSFIRRTTGSALEPTVEEPQTNHRTPRQRRLSESDFTRFGSGASRRNGVVEPDHNPGEGSRSWIIYVLGGSYPENHPILTTPSLFTDSPTYEDMVLLSTLLGPAKPPVASEEDVAAARGLYRIRGVSGSLTAEALDTDDSMSLASDARCLVCLCDFEADEEARKLVKCGHLFHKLCIDQWLTTGRNSCPLCRGEGVEEKPQRESDRTSPDLPPIWAQ